MPRIMPRSRGGLNRDRGLVGKVDRVIGGGVGWLEGGRCALRSYE